MTRSQYTNSTVMPASMSGCWVFVSMCVVLEPGQNQMLCAKPSIIPICSNILTDTKDSGDFSAHQFVKLSYITGNTSEART